jgi:dihydrofolate reductase
MEIALIAAMDKNRAIGINNSMPWHLPDDFAHFKRLTLNHPIIMGRKTFESIGRPLPSRRNMVVSRNANFTSVGVEVFASLEAAIEAAAMPEDALNVPQGDYLRVEGVPKASSNTVFIIGGATIYTQALPLAQRLYLTQVDAEINGDTWFPAIDATQWREASRVHHASDARHAYAFDFVELSRQTALSFPTAHMGAPLVDLTKALGLAAAMDDQETIAKLARNV